MSDPNAVDVRVVLAASTAPSATPGLMDLQGAGIVHWEPGTPHVAVVFLTVPQSRRGDPFEFEIDLVDGHGRPVSNEDGKPVAVRSTLTLGRREAMPTGTGFITAKALVFRAPPLPSGVYQWRITVDGQFCSSSVRVIGNEQLQSSGA